MILVWEKHTNKTKGLWILELKERKKNLEGMNDYRVKIILRYEKHNQSSSHQEKSIANFPGSQEIMDREWPGLKT